MGHRKHGKSKSSHCNCQTKCKRNMYKTIRNECDLVALTKAIKDAGLREAVSTSDPITVFGPTDYAFKNFTPGPTCGSLQETLLYHVVPQYLRAKDLKNDKLYDTLRPGSELGSQLKVRANVYKCPTFNNVVTINGVAIVEANIKATNGVLHKIEQVLCPPAGSLLDLALSNPDLSILVEAVLKANPVVIEALANPNLSLTLFAPTNQAFVALLNESGLTKEQLLNLPCLTDILLYHVLNVGTVFSPAIRCGYTDNVPTLLSNKTVTLKRKCNIKVKDELSRYSKVVSADNLTTNGVAHVVNRVLLPFNPCP